MAAKNAEDHDQHQGAASSSILPRQSRRDEPVPGEVNVTLYHNGRIVWKAVTVVRRIIRLRPMTARSIRPVGNSRALLSGASRSNSAFARQEPAVPAGLRAGCGGRPASSGGSCCARAQTFTHGIRHAVLRVVQSLEMAFHCGFPACKMPAPLRAVKPGS